VRFSRRRGEGNPALLNQHARRIINGQTRRAFGSRGRPGWAGGAKPHPGHNPANQAKKERAMRAALERDLAAIDAQEARA
jgi:hypothetical protein